MPFTEKELRAESARRITGQVSVDIQHELGKLYGAVNTYAKTGKSNLETAYDRSVYSEDAIGHIVSRLEADGFSVAVELTPEWHLLKVDWSERANQRNLE